MPTVRATLVLLCMAPLAGCAGPRLAEDAPTGVNLAGVAQIFPGASAIARSALALVRKNRTA